MKNEIQYKQLSAAEQIVLTLAGHGHTDQDIACKLQSSISTIRSQLRSAYSKLKARNRAHACVIALSLNVFDYDESLCY